MTGETENAKSEIDQEEGEASTSRPSAPFLFGSPAFSFLSTEKHIIANSFNPIDVNSADDVRQSLKAAMASVEESKSQSQQPQKAEPDPESVKSPPDNNKESKSNSRGEPHRSKQKQHKKRRRAYLKLEIKEKTDSDPGSRTLAQKRRGRPPKAGPSKKPKRLSKSDFYKGKLTNYVNFENNSDRDSDLDTCTFY